jgi:hypothetical protein
VFSAEADATWKAVVLGGAGGAIFNQEGCIDHLTADPGCGKEYLDVADCGDNYCSTCTTDADYNACFTTVHASQCAAYGLDTACSTAFTNNQTAIGTTCFPAAGATDLTDLFKTVATLQCPN